MQQNMHEIIQNWCKDKHDEENAYGGLITYGGLDFENCEESIAYVKVNRLPRWQFRLSRVAAGNYTAAKEWQADTASSFIKGPSDIISGMAKALGAEYNQTKSLYFIDCNSPASMELGIGSRTYTLTAESLIIRVDEKLCILALSHHRGNPDWGLGAPFIREYCHVYDVDSQRVGFAKAR
ncbi:eukaryotic aspartyl protease [Ancylostoma duodenale]|uniref:Eukaryotic aspartyl protease n=1 Tax=Ancylostoma duodenale TaxID=51022 RepID=A0A0C2GH21_9BILA|nr:eukaryotic aspartyl protease [Ancylostoma duodenale]